MELPNLDMHHDKDVTGQGGRLAVSGPTNRLDAIVRKHYKFSSNKEGSSRG